MCTRRHFISALAILGVSPPLLAAINTTDNQAVKPTDSSTLTLDDRKTHERFMRLAIRQARKNPEYPFGAVIVHASSGKILAQGANTAGKNPLFHGEVVAMNDYVRQHGNQGWANVTLYTTGEPCAMCMSAMAWAGIPRVIWASTIDTIRAAGINQIDISASEIAARAASFYHPQALVTGVLAGQTDKLFYHRSR